MTLHSVKPNVFNIQGNAQSGPGLISLQGTLNLPPTYPLNSELKLTGHQVLISNLLESQIYAEPNLTLSFNPQGLKLAGSVMIPKATIQPKDFSNSVVTADDIEIVDTQSPNAYAVQSQLDLALGDAVYLNFQGLHAHLGGQFTHYGSTQYINYSHGTLVALDGNYDAYGQKLKLTHAD